MLVKASKIWSVLIAIAKAARVVLAAEISPVFVRVVILAPVSSSKPVASAVGAFGALALIVPALFSVPMPPPS